MDIRKTLDMPESSLLKPETGNFKSIKPQSEITLLEIQNFWNHKFMPEESINISPHSLGEIRKDFILSEKQDEISINMEYEKNGNKYYLDDKSRIIKCKAKPQYTEDGVRNIKEQIEAGGNERRNDDDGGHIVGRVLGGAEGLENLVPMRRTINRGDYKKMENEISHGLKEGKEVELEVQLQYKDDSGRPSKIMANYTIEDKVVQVKFENEPNSLDLLNDAQDKISEEDYRALKKELDDMYGEGSTMTITSIKTEYDDMGSPYKVTIGVLEEETCEKSYKVYEAR
ncbi:hypothetical protein EII17_01925 [Clostridiales bacterium COT073_COT-073]|nr:hypothetical protein EII17_01925 [Clostridiales bacterium COT073_COT-073]